MSTSDLYLIFRKSVRHLKEYRNGWGSGARIWTFMQNRYLPGSRNWIHGNNQALWDLAKDQSVPLHQRLCLAFTFDQSACPIERMAELGEAMKTMGRECDDDEPNSVNHMPKIGADLCELAKEKLDHRAIGIGLECTSVNDLWLQWKGDPKPFDIFAYVVKP